MDNDKIPYIAFESEMARYERSIKRLIVALILTIVMLFASNGMWLWFFNQFDYETDTITQDTEDGDNSYIGNDGAIINGAANSNGN